MEIKRERVTEPKGNDYIKVTVGDKSRLFDIGNEAGIEAWVGSFKPTTGPKKPLQEKPMPAELVDPEIVTTPSEPKKAAKGKKSA